MDKEECLKLSKIAHAAEAMAIAAAVNGVEVYDICDMVRALAERKKSVHPFVTNAQKIFNEELNHTK